MIRHKARITSFFSKRWLIALLVLFFIGACTYTLSQNAYLLKEHKALLKGGMECIDCHEDEFPNLPHTGDWAGEHGSAATTHEELCERCHSQVTCNECHEKTSELRPSVVEPEAVERRFIHRDDYRTRHALDAGLDQTRCLTCHNVSSCERCHRKEGITPDSGAGYHPPGWGYGHAGKARRDMVKCAACHDRGAKTLCLNCHRSKNPHPPGWDPSLKRDKNRVCKQCH